MSNTYPSFPLHLLLLLGVLLLAGESSSQVTSSDRATLLAIKKEWGNPRQLASWDPAAHADHCNWTGVACEGAGAAGGPRVVTGVSLPRLNITGGVPASVCGLGNLTRLDLSYNKLTGTIPASIAALPNLTDIRLFNNELSGELPRELGKHSPLGNLDVCNNHLSGPLPESLCANGKLYDIVAFNNSFSGELPANLGDCVLLTNLMLYNNRFSGEFPAKIWSFQKLTTVMIQNNSFTGALPAEISLNISRIEMGNNKFSGSFPTSATGLHVFKAENNQLSGELPANMSRLANIIDLSMSGNQLTGSIPTSVNFLQKLNSLNLSNNQISGVIPSSSIGLLPSLTLLDLSGNELTGGIPPDFSNLDLNQLNMSSNQLTGKVPLSLQSTAYEHSFLGNRRLCAKQDSTINLPTCGSTHDDLSKGLIIPFSMLAGIVLVSIAGIAWLLFRRRKDSQEVTDWKITAFKHLGFTDSDVLSNIREENVIGKGGSGTVYRIHLPARGGGNEDPGGNGRTVAVKKIWNTRKLDAMLNKEFESEVKVLSNIRHNNIIKLLCCISNQDKLLVYEYMENGSLDRWLHHREREGARAPLDWPTRLAIAIGAATGLSYMHHDCPQAIVHRDVKSSNILLDPEFQAKIADFGLARMLVKSGEPESVSDIAGTFGYMAPEYGCGRRVTEKVDVYSFGVVLLELTTGKVANDRGADLCLAEWARRRYQKGPPFNDVVDEHICDQAYLPDILSVFKLGVICTGENPLARPSMKAVLHHLIQCDRRSAEGTGACKLDYSDGGAPLLKAKKGGFHFAISSKWGRLACRRNKSGGRC